MKHRLAATGKTAAAVRHEPLALGLAYGLAEIGQAGFAEFAFAALRGVERNNVVAGFHAGYSGANVFHDPATFVTEYGRECALRVRARQGIGVRMTNAGCNNAHQGFSLARTLPPPRFRSEAVLRRPRATAARAFITVSPYKFSCSTNGTRASCPRRGLEALVPGVPCTCCQFVHVSLHSQGIVRRNFAVTPWVRRTRSGGSSPAKKRSRFSFTLSPIA